MISLHFDNLRLFIPQYLFSTAIAAIVYYYLGQRYPGKENTIPILRKARTVGQSFFSTPLSSGTGENISLLVRPKLFNDSLRSYWDASKVFFDLAYYYLANGFPENQYANLKSPYVAPPFFETTITYQMYRIMVAVSAWAGLMLVITPFTYVYVFIPHFAEPYNIIVAIILGISIFEGIVSMAFFRLGVSFGKAVFVESIVIVAFTSSLLSPSMSWLSAFNLQGKLIIYLILLFLFIAITGLISQLRTRRNLFLSSMVFSTVAYFSFVVIVLYNVLQISL